mmetsp:Transcript_12591/g.34909  ORF Transcript_12591/g.34909 Transcript_12591/m.34909 type:complete len:640 (-) Transcript_12591:526-2445(-)
MDAAVIRTAQDAFQAKASAFLTVGYKMASSSRSTDTFREQAGDSILFTNYLKLLKAFQPLVDNHRKSRQSPLVNAGYALRVATLLEQIQRFLWYHQESSHANNREDDATPSTASSKIRVMVLGAGLDPLGLATLLSWLQQYDNNNIIQLVEIDLASIVQTKREIVTELCDANNILPLQPTSQSTNHHYSFNCSGTPSHSSYHLMTTDLRDLAAVEKGLAPILDQEDTPTLILSELVLAYLPPTSCNALLQWLCSTFLKQSSCHGSAMILYEPCGESWVDQERSITSVTHGFHHIYFDRFQAKLDRGKSGKPTSPNQDEMSPSFFPIATSPFAVAARLQSAGCAVSAHTVSAEQACFHLLPTSFLSQPVPEMFDEHAALRLYLRSYCVSCLFSRNDTATKEAKTPGLLPRILCPWTTCHSRVGPFPVMLSVSSRANFETSATARIWISPILPDDEDAVQKLFVQSYRHLFAEYPSVQKMTKSALKKDLAMHDSNVQKLSSMSRIGIYYKERGGVFLVAIVPDTMEEGPQLVGSIGVRKCDAKEKGVRAPTTTRQTFEIHRLFVHPDCRSRGVARELLNRAIRHVMASQRLCNGVQEICLVATTLALLVGATRFYEKQGFQILEEETVANLDIRTYGKVLR